MPPKAGAWVAVLPNCIVWPVVPTALWMLSLVVYVCGVAVGLVPAGFNQNLVPTPMPTAMNNSATQPWKLNRLVCTMPLPTVQPPANEAPTPIIKPPPMERTAVVASGMRMRNSPVAFAAIKAPTSNPRTSITPQSTNASSPVTPYCKVFAVGPVMPRPLLRPVAADSGHAITPIIPIRAPAVYIGNGRFQRGWLSNRATCGRLASWARKCQTSTPVPSAKTIANHHGETPKNSGRVVRPVSQLFIQPLKSDSAPFLMAAADKAYIARAIHDPTSPSAERYQVPEAQPPAKMIPRPKTNPPTITAAGAKVVCSGAMTPVEVSAASPSACTAMTISNATKVRQEFARKMSRIIPVTQNRPRCMTTPNNAPSSKPVRIMEPQSHRRLCSVYASTEYL